MPSVTLYPPTTLGSQEISNPFPTLIQTPTGLALLEIQGTLHTPFSRPDAATTPSLEITSGEYPWHETSVGRIVFPLYNRSIHGEEDSGWMKRVYLYVGKHQRLTGEVKKLGKPVAVLRKRVTSGTIDGTVQMEDTEESQINAEELEIVEIIKFKILFAGRPEPVGE